MRTSCLTRPCDSSLPVAVFVSNYNTSNRLYRTLDSLRHQTHQNFDIYLIDAGSSDCFLSVVREFEDIIFSIIQRPDNGLYDGLANAFSKAVNGYQIYSYLNAGDLYAPYCLEVVSSVFSSHAVDWITGLPTTRDDKYQLISVSKPLPYYSPFIANLLHSGFLLPAIQQESCFWSATLHSSISFELLSQLRLAGDAYLWSVFARKATLYIVNCSLAAFTLHGAHLSSTGYNDELLLLRPRGPRLLILLPLALLYGLLQRFIRLPEKLYSALPRILPPHSS